MSTGAWRPSMPYEHHGQQMQFTFGNLRQTATQATVAQLSTIESGIIGTGQRQMLGPATRPYESAPYVNADVIKTSLLRVDRG